jgi:ribosomal protein L29
VCTSVYWYYSLKPEISEIIETENQLFNLRLKLRVKLSNPHEIKFLKCRLAQLKTLLTSNLRDTWTSKIIA